MNFKIEPEFADLIPPLNDLEYETLEQSIIEEGCREPLIIWAGENILLDGHNRFKICLENKIEYKVVKKEFDDENAAKNWMLMNQLGRRNLSPDNLAILRGQLYKLAKKPVSNPAGSNQHNEDGGKICHQPKSAEAIAKLTGVSEKTIRNDAKFSNAVDNLTKKIDPNFKKNIQAGKRENTKEAIVEAGSVAETNPKKAQEILKNDIEKKTEPKKEVTQRQEPAFAMQFATMAISQLERIMPKDPDRQKAFDKVVEWIKNNR